MATERVVYVDRSRVRDGRLEDLRVAMAELAAFVEANEPRIRSYDVYFDDDGRRMTVVHVHDDAASLADHMRIAGPEFPPIGEFVELEAIDVFGRPDEELVRRLAEKADELGSGRVTVHEHHTGFGRFGAD